MASYKLLIKISAGKELEELPSKRLRRQLVSRILALSDDARPPGSQKLAGFEDRYRLRQGSYRIVYEVDDRSRVVTVVKIGHRREVYR